MSPMDVEDRVDRVGPVLGARTARTMAVDVDECGSDVSAGGVDDLALAEAALSFQPSPRPRATTVPSAIAIHVSAVSSENVARSPSRMHALWMTASAGICSVCVIRANASLASSL
jgi:hypothetical protein